MQVNEFQNTPVSTTKASTFLAFFLIICDILMISNMHTYIQCALVGSAYTCITGCAHCQLIGFAKSDTLTDEIENLMRNVE